jgi:hypothetical protein
MAKDELESITEDRWDEDIWGIEHADSKSRTGVPKLVFYFGEHVSLCAKPGWTRLMYCRTTGYRTIFEMS